MLTKNWIHQRAWYAYFFLIGMLLLFVFFLKRCRFSQSSVNETITSLSKSKQAYIKVDKAVPVVLSRARCRDVPVFLPALGSVTPVQSITVKTQINGQLLHTFFDDGAMVKSGDKLAAIDPRPFQAQLIQFEGQLARDQALLANARLDLKRYKNLYPIGAVSKQTYDTQVWLTKQLEGTVRSDQGLLDGVKLNLNYCDIRSPITGKLGLWLVKEGNYVQTNDVSGLVLLNTLSPMAVVFSIPEDNLPQVMKQFQTNPKKLIVKAYNRDQSSLLATGTLGAIDSQIDPSTGTVKLKADFQNEDHRLFPNQFVNIQLLVETFDNAIVIPTAAIQYGTEGTFVYLFDKNNKTVHVKPVVVGVVSGNETMIKSGILPDESVVLEGIDKLTDGINVVLSQNKKISQPDSSQEPRGSL